MDLPSTSNFIENMLLVSVNNSEIIVEKKNVLSKNLIKI